jgi:GntR family transcriptional regulator, rspAB operon transcriptional repressor
LSILKRTNSGVNGAPRRGRPRKPTAPKVEPERSSLSERVYQALKRDIVTGVFQSGEAVTEKVLARRYRGSRTPVREAAVRLQHEHLLRIVPNRGYFVSHITLRQLNEIYEFRAAVECTAAELAAQRNLDVALVSRLTQLANTKYTIEDRASYEHFIEADTEYHIGIARLSANHLLVRAVEDARCQMERIMYAAIDIGYYGEMPVKEHMEILRAIQERNPSLARKVMYQHIFGSKHRVLQLASS